MSRTTGPVDRIIWGKLDLEGFGAAGVDFIAAPADPRSDSSEDGRRLSMKLLTHTLDGCGYNSRCDAFSSRMHNAHGRQTRSDQDNWEAIRRDDGQGEMRAIGDEAISWRSPHELRVTSLSHDDDPIAMHLPQGYQITGIDANRPTEPGTVPLDARAIIAAAETQVQRGIGRLAHAPKASAEGMHDESMLTHGCTCEERNPMFSLERESTHLRQPTQVLAGEYTAYYLTRSLSRTVDRSVALLPALLCAIVTSGPNESR
jgi:hypothetical protein